MNRLDRLFKEYSKSHQNPLNRKIHFICVPAIFWSIVALLWALLGPWAQIPAVIVMGVYFWLSLRHGLFMVAIIELSLALAAAVETAGLPLLPIALAIFIVAWIGQFYGHKVEGQKPSFLKDLIFLLIGPLWVLEKIRY